VVPSILTVLLVMRNMRF